MANILFADWLNEKLESSNMSQAQLARRSGLSRTAISDYINGKRLNPDKEALTAIAHGLSIPTSEIFQATGILPQSNNIPPEISRAMYQLEQLPEPLRSILTKMIDAQYQQWENDQTANLKPRPKPNG